ncbi:MAG: hypothetical protein PHY44_05115 [Lachnospiraceae bacterium]|nr:hypothetical protein [Lachnospiraceae bacterium]
MYYPTGVMRDTYETIMPAVHIFINTTIDKCLEVDDIHNAPYEVTAEKLYKAIADLEEYNKKNNISNKISCCIH